MFERIVRLLMEGALRSYDLLGQLGVILFIVLFLVAPMIFLVLEISRRIERMQDEEGKE